MSIFGYFYPMQSWSDLSGNCSQKSTKNHQISMIFSGHLTQKTSRKKMCCVYYANTILFCRKRDREYRTIKNRTLYRRLKYGIRIKNAPLNKERKMCVLHGWTWAASLKSRYLDYNGKLWTIKSNRQRVFNEWTNPKLIKFNR